MAGVTSCAPAVSVPDSLSSLARSPWVKILPGLSMLALPGLLGAVEPALGARSMSMPELPGLLAPVAPVLEARSLAKVLSS